MLLELYITVMILNFVVFGLAFFRQNVWLWSISLVLGGLLIFASLDIVQNTAVVANQTVVNSTLTNYSYDSYQDHTSDLSLFILNLGVFALALILFLNDLWMSFKEGRLGERKL